MNLPCLDHHHTGIDKRDVVAFFDELAPGWDRDLIVDRDKIKLILDTADIHPGVRVLDVACGTGVLFPFYVHRQVREVLAVDIAPEMAKIAAAKARPPIRVLCRDIQALPGTGDYDCCVVYNAFPHFPDPAGLVRDLAAWLRPGGRLTIAHSMGIEQLNRHHSGRAAQVSVGMLPAKELAGILGEWFQVDTAVSDREKYIVSGTLQKKN